MMYKLYVAGFDATAPNAAMTVGVDPQISFKFDPANTDYQAYLAWLAEGNEPLAADAPADQPTE
jgi:hypothetical protein